ncbi:MAG: hypothetical protein K940chlam3_01595 [Chlamydiae bacterium]|nr:hypothetical protein [Chlamydiota bacterium]
MTISDSKTEVELKSVIEKALKKINGAKENGLCRYLPMDSGGYMHHFTFRKMKGESPKELIALITTHVIDANKPQTVTPKPRAPRGSRKRRDQLHFTKHDIERILHMARMAGDKEMIRKLTQKDLKQIRRELINSIKTGRIEPDLWNAYVEAVTNHNASLEAIASGHTLVAN